jgi:hypothetical protein
VSKATNIEEVMVKADTAPEPEGLAKGEVVSKDAAEASPMNVTELTSAGWVYIYDTKTHERSITNKNMLRAQLLKKRPDGSTVFTTSKPDEVPFRGTLKCLLHPDDPNRGHYDELGLPVCKKSNLTSPFQVKRHMEKRHRMEYQTIETERKETKEANEQAQVLALMKKLK